MDKPAHKKAAYLRIVAQYKPNKADPCRIRWTCGGDKIEYVGDVSTPRADLSTVKCHINSVVSTPKAKNLVLDIQDFYLNSTMVEFEYMRIPVKFIPEAIMILYNLYPLVHDGYIMVEIRKGMYGLPQAGILANQQLTAHLAQYGYVPAQHMPGLFTHTDRPISFVLTVDDFLAVKYVSKEHADHLIQALEAKYKITIDWEGKQYCGLTLNWDYESTPRTCDISMPGYTEPALTRFNHPPPTRPQHSPHAWQAPQYGAASQLTAPKDTSDSPAGILFLQQVLGVRTLYFSPFVVCPT
jgi:Reverse transcriptase (RNA-dependent DNA polymerase)